MNQPSSLARCLWLTVGGAHTDLSMITIYVSRVVLWAIHGTTHRYRQALLGPACHFLTLHFVLSHDYQVATAQPAECQEAALKNVAQIFLPRRIPITDPEV